MVDIAPNNVLAPDEIQDIVSQKAVIRKYVGRTFGDRLDPPDIRFRGYLRILNEYLAKVKLENVLTNEHILCYALYLSVRAAQLDVDLQSPHRIEMAFGKDLVVDSGEKFDWARLWKPRKYRLTFKWDDLIMYEPIFQKDWERAIEKFFTGMENDVRECTRCIQETGKWLEHGRVVVKKIKKSSDRGDSASP